MCRAYASEDDIMNLQKEYIRCLEQKTDFLIGWTCLKIIESQCKVQTESNILELNFRDCLLEMKNSGNTWMGVFDLVQGLIYIWNQNFLSAEEFVAQACLLASPESCLQLCHGVTGMELARTWSDSQFLSLAVKSLTNAQDASVVPLPIISALLAQAEGSLGSKEKWKNNLRLEWFTWPPNLICLWHAWGVCVFCVFSFYISSPPYYPLATLSEPIDGFFLHFLIYAIM